MYIYKIDIPATGQSYIGQTTKHYEIRFKQHKNPKSISLIGRAIQHWGNPTITVLHKVDSREELNRLETEEIKTRKTIFPFGYNLSEGGAAEYAKHRDDNEYQYTPDDSELNLPATIEESRKGFRPFIRELIQERYIDDDEYYEIANDFGVSNITIKMEHWPVRIANNIWKGKVASTINSKSWWGKFDIRLQQGFLSYEELMEMMENSGENKQNVLYKNGKGNEILRQTCNNIHARVAEAKSLTLPKP